MQYKFDKETFEDLGDNRREILWWILGKYGS
jgi:hypothetical protein